MCFLVKIISAILSISRDKQLIINQLLMLNNSEVIIARKDLYSKKIRSYRQQSKILRCDENCKPVI